MKMIPLSQGEHAVVDNDVYEYLIQWSWCADFMGNSFYAARGEGRWPHRKLVLMHRVIADAPTGMDVDHINGNGLDNRRENLRVCTHAENQRNRRKNKDNTSGFKGVFWHKNRKRYQAQIKICGKKIHLGYFLDPAEAAHAYDEAAKKYFGEFARLNFE